MPDHNTPNPETDEEPESKVLDDLDPDEAEAAGIQGGGRVTKSSNFNYGDGPVSRK